ncbi:MAG: Ig-like domain-containing protein, partial [Mariprofundaceae bacterium]|nr:Ig-like domain-containing protein [Mariprofundaceae bacterium]
MKSKWITWMVAVLCTVLMTSCKGADGGSGTLSTVSPMVANFDPSKSIIPFPNNVLFSGSLDGTLNIPVVSATDFTDPKVAMNALDGFSTVAAITTTFSLPLDKASIAAGVRVFEVTTAGALKSYAVTGITRELISGADFAALPSPTSATTLVIKPLKPLKSNTNYMVTISNALAATTGQGAVASRVFSLLKQTTALVSAAGTSLVPGVADASAVQLEGLRQLSNAMILNVDTYAAANAVTQLPRANVALVWSFKTQTIGKTLAAIQAASATDPYASVAANFITFPATPSAATGGLGVLDSYSFAIANNVVDLYTAGAFTNIGSVIIGAAKLPYYLDEYTAANPLGPITGRFQVDTYGMPALKSVQTVPFLMTVP